MTIHAVGRDQLTRRARSNESEAVCVRHQVPEELSEAFSGQVRGGVLPEERITMSSKIAIPVIAVALAFAFSAHACDNCNRGHRSIGVTIIPLVVLRIIYRWTHPPLPLPTEIPAIQKLAAHATHWGLYVLLIVQPFTGWIATSAYRAPIIVFGLFELPPIWPENRALSEQLFFVHTMTGLAIACLATAHIGAALYHHFVRRDRVLLRMITG
jgi:cytochrome b561